MEKLKLNPNNKKYYSEEFIKGFECGVERQFEKDKAEIQPIVWGKWIKQKSGDEMFPEEIVCSKCYHANSHLDFDEHYNPIGKVFLNRNIVLTVAQKWKNRSKTITNAEHINPTLLMC